MLSSKLKDDSHPPRYFVVQCKKFNTNRSYISTVLITYDLKNLRDKKMLFFFILK